MNLSHSPDQSQAEISRLEWKESQARVNTVIQQVNDIFDKNPEEKEMVYETLKGLLSMLILKHPGELVEILDKVDQRYQKRLEWFGYHESYKRRQEAIDQYTKFLTEMGDTITAKAQNIPWQNEAKFNKEQYENKKISLIGTYTRIIEDLKPTK